MVEMARDGAMDGSRPRRWLDGGDGGAVRGGGWASRRLGVPGVLCR